MRIRHRAAGRYARAMLDLAAESGDLERVHDDLTALQSLIGQLPQLSQFLPNYQLPRSVRARALSGMFANKIHPLAYRLLMFLEAKRRLGLLDEICASFQEQYDVKRGLIKGRVVSAFELDPGQKEALAASARRHVAGSLELSFDVAPVLLGGFRMQIDDDLYDVSIATRLQALRERIASV